MVNALVKDLTTLCVGHRKPDLIVFSGDLVHAAGVDSHEEAYDVLIDRVSKATGVSDARLFLSPGNHDAATSAVEKHAADTKEWREIVASGGIARLNELYEAKSFDGALLEKFSSFFDLDRYLTMGERSHGRRFWSPFAAVDHVEALNLDIVSFNTAAFSAASMKSLGGDDKRLAIPEYAVMEAVSALKPGSIRVFVTHHPTSWFSDDFKKYFDGALEKHANIHLFGHMHDPQPKKLIGLRGEVLDNQSGAIFTQRREYYNGYALITVDKAHHYAETLIRSYFSDREEFDEGVDIVENGRWWSSQEAREHFKAIGAPIDEGAFRQHLSGPALVALCDREAATGGYGDLHGKFIPPPLQRTFIQDVPSDDNKIEIETSIPFSNLVESDSNLIIYSRAEYGRTTLLRELRYRLLKDGQALRFPRLPVILDFREITSNADNMLRKARGNAEALPEGHDLQALLKLGHVCVMIDDVLFEDGPRMRVLRDFVARYLFSSVQSSATKLGASVDPEMPVRFEFVEIKEFGRNDMRQLLAKEERCTNVEEWLDRLQEEFKEINLPFTAANGSILIEILSEKYNFNPINRSVLIEQFIDSTLRKAAIEQSKRETFDYTNKTDLLSHVAAWMAKNGEYAPSREATRSEIKSYLDSKGLNANLDVLMMEFFSARIFIDKSEARLSFRYRSVLQYFIALRMTVDQAFKDWVLEEERYLRFTNEIQYYAGKLRNDADLVNLVAARHDAIMAAQMGDVTEADLRQLESRPLPLDKKNQAFLIAAREMADTPLSQEEKDLELETGMLRDTEDRQDMIRPDVIDAQDMALYSLTLYSGLVKNMELISDSEKRIHLTKVLYGWATLLVGALTLSPVLAKERRLRINGALYEVQAPHGMETATLLRKMMLVLPHIHIKMLSHAVGTEKLERQLTEPTLTEDGQPKIIDFLRVGLISDLRLSATPSSVSALAARLRDNKYLLWALIVHVSELRRLDRVKEEHFRELEKPLAGAIADLRGGSPKDRANIKRQQLARLERDRLMLTMKKARD